LFSYLETEGLSWEIWVGICTDGAPQWLGPVEVSPPFLKGENPDIVTTHRVVLLSKYLGDEIRKVLDDATTMVNFIKQRPIDCIV
jgi:hypothetical protein